MTFKKKQLKCAIIHTLQNRCESLLNLCSLLSYETGLLTYKLSLLWRYRSVWHLPRNNTVWWESACDTYSNCRFKQALRLFGDTLQFVLTPKQNKLVKQYIDKESIRPGQLLGLCLYQLWKRDYFYTVVEFFRLLNHL